MAGRRGEIPPCDRVTYTIRETFLEMVTNERSGQKRGRREDSSNKSVSPPEKENTCGMDANNQDLLRTTSNFQLWILQVSGR